MKAPFGRLLCIPYRVCECMQILFPSGIYIRCLSYDYIIYVFDSHSILTQLYFISFPCFMSPSPMSSEFSFIFDRGFASDFTWYKQMYFENCVPLWLLNKAITYALVILCLWPTYILLHPPYSMIKSCFESTIASRDLRLEFNKLLRRLKSVRGLPYSFF